jgi:hypothetical protein
MILHSSLRPFSVRILRNNLTEAIAAYCLTPLERREQQVGDSLRKSAVCLRVWRPLSLDYHERESGSTIVNVTSATVNAVSASDLWSLDFASLSQGNDFVCDENREEEKEKCEEDSEGIVSAMPGRETKKEDRMNEIATHRSPFRPEYIT